MIQVLKRAQQEELKVEDSLGYIVLNKSEEQRSRGSENSDTLLTFVEYNIPGRYCVKGFTHTLLTH